MRGSNDDGIQRRFEGTRDQLQWSAGSEAASLRVCALLLQAVDKRVLTAAAEVTARGLARITLLGDPVTVRAEAAKLGVDISACRIIDPVVRRGGGMYKGL